MSDVEVPHAPDRPCAADAMCPAIHSPSCTLAGGGVADAVSRHHACAADSSLYGQHRPVPGGAVRSIPHSAVDAPPRPTLRPHAARHSDSFAAPPRQRIRLWIGRSFRVGGVDDPRNQWAPEQPATSVVPCPPRRFPSVHHCVTCLLHGDRGAVSVGTLARLD